jgi:hypothetical protein
MLGLEKVESFIPALRKAHVDARRTWGLPQEERKQEACSAEEGDEKEEARFLAFTRVRFAENSDAEYRNKHLWQRNDTIATSENRESRGVSRVDSSIWAVSSVG